MKKIILFALLVLGFGNLNAQSNLKIGLNNNFGITQQPYHSWENNNETIFETGLNYSTGLLLEKQRGSWLFRTGLHYQYTTFENMNKGVTFYAYAIFIPTNNSYFSAPRLEQQSFHQLAIPLSFGYQIINRKKMKISWLVEATSSFTFSKKETYSGYYTHPLIEFITIERGTIEHKQNQSDFRGVNFQTGISVQHQIGEKWTIFWQPMIGILEYKTSNDISKIVGLSSFSLNDPQFIAFKNFGIGFGVLRQLSVSK